MYKVIFVVQRAKIKHLFHFYSVEGFDFKNSPDATDKINVVMNNVNLVIQNAHSFL